MALYKTIEKHQITILGQNIIYTNRFIKYSKEGPLSIIPSNNLVSYICSRFKYEYTHDKIGPTLFYSKETNKKYILPTWQEVHLETTLEDIDWIKPIPKEIPKQEQIFTFESSSEKNTFYKVKKIGDKITCNCSGFFRVKDKFKGCKHVQIVRKQTQQ
jgi:hypothetical protein